MKYSTKQNGISLVELLVASAISLFLILSIFTVYLSNKKTYQYDQSLAYLQENARLAFLSLTHDIHMARSITYIPSENALQLKILTPDSNVKVLDNQIKVSHLQTIKYFIKRDKQNSKITPVLYRKDMGNINMPSGLIDNVNSITWLFYSKDNPTHEYIPTEINDWSKIIGVKVLLTLSSTNQRLQRQLSMVIALRNPLT